MWDSIKNLLHVGKNVLAQNFKQTEKEVGLQQSFLPEQVLPPICKNVSQVLTDLWRERSIWKFPGIDFFKVGVDSLNLTAQYFSLLLPGMDDFPLLPPIKTDKCKEPEHYSHEDKSAPGEHWQRLQDSA